MRQVEKIETAVEPRFQAHFVEAMAFPHRTADYPNLLKAVDLPPRPEFMPRPEFTAAVEEKDEVVAPARFEAAAPIDPMPLGGAAPASSARRA